jgi:DNA repair exonuclease SbcCD ATPase subunit
VVREIHASRRNLTSKYALEEVRTFTIKNVDAKAKTLIIEHPQRQGYKLLEPSKASETTANANRFEVKLSASATETFVLREERVYDQTISVNSMTPDSISVWLENKVLTAAGRRQLEQLAAKKREIANNDAALKQAESSISDLTQDQTRVRANIQSLNNVNNQQDLVQQYASQLAANETKMVALRDSQSDLKRKKTALESELAAMMERLDF